MSRRWIAAGVAALLALAVGSTPAVAGAPTKLKVKLLEYTIKGVPEELDAGTYKLVVTNRGVEDHEVIVVEGSDPEDLPLDEPGVLDESALDDVLVGETGDIGTDKKRSVTIDLEPGSYIFLCNVLHDHAHSMDKRRHGHEDDGHGDSDKGHMSEDSAGHFGEGMYVVVTVS